MRKCTYRCTSVRADSGACCETENMDVNRHEDCSPDRGLHSMGSDSA